MKPKKLGYSTVALSKRKAIKRDVKNKHGQFVADRISDRISKVLSDLKKQVPAEDF